MRFSLRFMASHTQLATPFNLWPRGLLYSSRPSSRRYAFAYGQKSSLKRALRRCASCASRDSRSSSSSRLPIFITIPGWRTRSGLPWRTSAGSFHGQQLSRLGRLFSERSDTASNLLFGNLQVAAAHQMHLNPVLLAVTNSSGAVTGKMISPQNIAVGVTTVGLIGEEGKVLRSTFWYSMFFALLIGVLAFAQAHCLAWMVPENCAMIRVFDSATCSARRCCRRTLSVQV